MVDMSAELSSEKKSFLRYWAIGISITYVLIALLVVYIVQGERILPKEITPFEWIL
jgi:hypothetical protein